MVENGLNGFKWQTMVKHGQNGYKYLKILFLLDLKKVS
jgi:hypothetical protein